MMDDELDELDWGNEDDEVQQPCVELTAYSHMVPDQMDADEDGEDAVSLGDEDEDEDQVFYNDRRDDAPDTQKVFLPEESRPASRSSALLEAKTSGANGSQSALLSPQASQQHRRKPSSTKGSSSPQKLPQSIPSPTQKQLPRVYHALPPKPVSSAAAPLPSFPSTAAATSMTNASPRSILRETTKTTVLIASSVSLPAILDLPKDWESRVSKDDRTYYPNRIAEENSRIPTSTSNYDPPVSKILDHRMDDTTRLSSGFKVDRPLRDEDRYYRPGADSVAISNSLDMSGEFPSATIDRRNRSPAPQRRKSARSNSPIGIHIEPPVEMESLSAGSGRRRQRASANTPRLLDSYVPEPGHYTHRRSPSPTRDYSPVYDGNRGYRRNHDDQDDNFMRVDHPDTFTGRPPRHEEYTGRSREADYSPRRADGREPHYRKYQSSQKPRSPPPGIDPHHSERGRERESRENDREKWDRDYERDQRPTQPPPSARYYDQPPRLQQEPSIRNERERGREPTSRYDRHDRSPPRISNYLGRPAGMDSYRPTYPDDVDRHKERPRSPPPPPRVPQRVLDRSRRHSPPEDRSRPKVKDQSPGPSYSEETTQSPPLEQTNHFRRSGPLPPQAGLYRQRKALPPSSNPRDESVRRREPSPPTHVSTTRDLNIKTTVLHSRSYSPENARISDVDRGRKLNDTAPREADIVQAVPLGVEKNENTSRPEKRLPPTGPAKGPLNRPERMPPKRKGRAPKPQATGTNDIPLENRRGYGLPVATPQLPTSSLLSPDSSIPTQPRELHGGQFPRERVNISSADRGSVIDNTVRGRPKTPPMKAQDERRRVNEPPHHVPRNAPRNAPSSINGASSQEVATPPISREDSVLSSTMDESSARHSIDGRESRPPSSDLDRQHSDLGLSSFRNLSTVQPQPQPEHRGSEYPVSPSLQRRLSMGNAPLPPRLRKPLISPERVPSQTQTAPPLPQPENRVSIAERMEPQPSLKRGTSGSLLDRMSSDHDRMGRQPPEPVVSSNSSLKDRIVPAKRDLEEMREVGYGGSDRPRYDDGHETKRIRKRGGRGRRGPPPGVGGGRR